MDNQDNNQNKENSPNEEPSQESSDSLTHLKQLSGMYQNWFLDYASYVILERAVPYIYDGLKPVQRRILHAMYRIDDGRFHKVANIIGHTMQFHPHGDASIGEALIQLGQKGLLIDTQGNWGNTFTGDSAAAPRYIEARLSKFAKEVAFNPKTTEWKDSYDGRNKEPEMLPVKFPLLLAQGVEGIAVGLSSKILPHNFNEIIDACIQHLQGKDFTLYPDFPTGGYIDVSKYKDGAKGGRVRVRAKIEKRDKRNLVITDLPYGKTTNTLIDSILNANDKKKIKVKHINDNTAEFVEILVNLPANSDPDLVIDALYAFTDCEVSISPNACIIDEERPHFLSVSHILRVSTDNTLNLLKRELEIRLEELENDWHASSLEKIFIENKIYSHIEQCETWNCILKIIDEKLEPFKKLLRKPVTKDDLIRLTEIKIKRISKYDSFKADQHIKAVEEEMEKIRYHLDNIVDYTIKYFKRLKKKYGAEHKRKTEIRNFDTIQATQVVANNEKLYVNRKEGFIGTGLKKAEYVMNCSDIDDIIVFRRDGKYIVTRVASKVFVGKDIIHLDVFRKNDDRTVYNVLYMDGATGFTMTKRFSVKSVTRDKEYDLTKGNSYSRVLYFSANPSGEAETVKITLKPKPRLKKPILECDFSEVVIKGRQAQGNIFTRHAVHKVTLKQKGNPTLGGQHIWFDFEVLRLNDEERGKYLGEFFSDEKVVALMRSGLFMLYTYELTNHFEPDLTHIDKFDEDKVYTAVYYEGELGFFYIKRFKLESVMKMTSFIGENQASYLVALSDEPYPRFRVSFGGPDAHRQAMELDAVDFIAVKSYKARGKRITNYQVKLIKELAPRIPREEVEANKEENQHQQNTPVPGDNGKGSNEEAQGSIFD